MLQDNARLQGERPVRLRTSIVREPSLDELLGDEMMPAVMRSAGLDRVGLRAMLAEVAGRLPLRPRSACSAEPDCQPSAA
jgi:hypothetical protein